MILPEPRQRPHVRATVKKPCWNAIWPVPLQVPQVVGLLPAAAPDPAQVSHFSCRGTRMVLVAPKRPSSKSISMV